MTREPRVETDQYLFLEARAYMLQHILHDFSSDDACRLILKNIVPAMKRGYSKLLIKELLIPGLERAMVTHSTRRKRYAVTLGPGADGSAIPQSLGVSWAQDRGHVET
jgi:hypothetical protein